MSRLAGRFLQIRIEDFSLRMSKVNLKEVAMERLVRHMERDCPKCVGCGEAKLHEQEDYMRMTKLFGVSCKQNVRNNGDIVRCPDGFYGIYDATEKEVKEVKLEMPTVTYEPDELGKTAWPGSTFAHIEVGTISAKKIGVDKISAALVSFGPGSTTGYTSSEARFNPNIFDTERPAGVKAAPKINRDAPITIDGDAW